MFPSSPLSKSICPLTIVILLSRLESSIFALATKLGNDLVIGQFNSVGELGEILDAVITSDYDNVFVDSITAVTQMLDASPVVQKARDKNVFDSFRMIGDATVEIILKMKEIAEEHGKNAFISIALKPKIDVNGNLINVDAVTKGNMALESIKALCPTIVCVAQLPDEEGNLQRTMLTKSHGVFSARIDSLLDEDNPGQIAPDLSALFNLVKKEY